MRKDENGEGEVEDDSKLVQWFPSKLLVLPVLDHPDHEPSKHKEG